MSYWIFCILFPCHLPPANSLKNIENFFVRHFVAKINFPPPFFFHKSFFYIIFFCQNFFSPRNFFPAQKNFRQKFVNRQNFYLPTFFCQVIFLARKTQLGQKGITFAAEGCSPPQELIIFRLNEPALWRKHWPNLKSNYNIGKLPITVSQKTKLHFEVRNFINFYAHSFNKL